MLNLFLKNIYHVLIIESSIALKSFLPEDFNFCWYNLTLFPKSLEQSRQFYITCRQPLLKTVKFVPTLESTCTIQRIMMTIILFKSVACDYMRNTNKLRIVNMLIIKPDLLHLHAMGPGVASY